MTGVIHHVYNVQALLSSNAHYASKTTTSTVQYVTTIPAPVLLTLSITTVEYANFVNGAVKCAPALTTVQYAQEAFTSTKDGATFNAQ